MCVTEVHSRGMWHVCAVSRLRSKGRNVCDTDFPCNMHVQCRGQGDFTQTFIAQLLNANCHNYLDSIALQNPVRRGLGTQRSAVQ